ncbi:MAG TPA: aminotransferase class I/II-fold pyridoxal phosphate-dependent enzyme [Cyclobacteriaceae bacterium]|nr:aminotransferase class I/II-fold pyridoxal phosphate-dependent enzyme [Cyclobacteriaceae bacterium]
MSRIFLSPPHIGDLEQKYVEEAFRTNWISPAGPHITAFENELALYLGEGVHVAALSSGTAAIHLALIILGVKPGDEVICSTFTFSGSVNPVVYVGATPVFVESDHTTWNMDPNFLRQAIVDRVARTGKKPKAIISVDLYGIPARLDEITAISREFDIPLIEDAAEALGSTYRGKKLGTFGDFGILSFNGNKIITTSGGGALVSKNPVHIETARFLATQARDKAPHYQHSQIGYNYRLSNVCAGIGRGQLKVLDERVKSRRSNFDYYAKNLGAGSDFLFLPEPEGAFSNRWLTTTLVRNGGVTPEKLRLALEKEDIESRPLWKPMHLQPVFASMPYYGKNLSESLFNEGLCLPSGSALDDVNLGRVVACLRAVV